MTTYYDAVLGIIPVALLGTVGVLSVAGVSLTTAVPVAAALPIALIGHALFVNGPVESPDDADAVSFPNSAD